MPIHYECADCHWKRSVGGYHGWPGEWYVDLYCKQCGAAHRLLTRTGEAPGGTDKQTFLNDALVPLDQPGTHIRVECAACGAQGPLGSQGPITDQPPTQCPACSGGNVRATGEWIS